jgi:hypothetical protein
MADTWHDHFQPGETLLWEGAPLPGVRNRARLVVLSLFGLPFLLIGMFGAATGLRHVYWLGETGLGLFTLVISLIFVLLGYTLVFHQWLDAARAHLSTRYALSNRCAYVIRQGRKQSLLSYPIVSGTALELDRCDGYDNVWFHVTKERDSDGDLTTSRVGFEGIADGTEVYRLFRSIQNGPA